MSIMCWKVWGVVPTSLVEAERNGATLVQRLAQMDTSSSSGSAVTDGNKKADGHKEEGWFTRLMLHALQEDNQADRSKQQQLV